MDSSAQTGLLNRKKKKKKISESSRFRVVSEKYTKTEINRQKPGWFKQKHVLLREYWYSQDQQERWRPRLRMMQLEKLWSRNGRGNHPAALLVQEACTTNTTSSWPQVISLPPAIPSNFVSLSLASKFGIVHLIGEPRSHVY